MTFNPLYHPRRPDGKFRDASLGEGWHGYMGRNGDCHFYYVHNREHLEEGFAVLQMAGSGRPMTLTDEDPNSRAHVIDSGEGEQMICSSSYHGAFGVTDHDSPAPPPSPSRSQEQVSDSNPMPAGRPTSDRALKITDTFPITQ